VSIEEPRDAVSFLIDLRVIDAAEARTDDD
jgi:hypothetical protein